MNVRFHELVAAAHPPFHGDGTLNLVAIETQAKHLLNSGVHAAFVCGTTGESHSLTLDDRLAVAKRWTEVARGTALRVIVHVGSNCLDDSRALAAHAQSHGAAAISALPPSYFKPKSIEELIACCARITDAAPALPFYYYDIPSLSGVALPMPEFLDAVVDGNRIPTLVGVKFTNPDMMAFQRCLRCAEGRFDIPWGVDEHLLGALALGARGAVGSTYNFAAPIYLRMWDAFSRGDLQTARVEQYRSVQLIVCLASFGYMGAAKALMEMLGVPVGPPRLPIGALNPERRSELRAELERLCYFDWGTRVA
jgi:N-acetylneuraminate lyase